MEPTCAAKEGCSCKEANAPAEEYSDAYKKFLLMWLEGTYFLLSLHLKPL